MKQKSVSLKMIKRGTYEENKEQLITQNICGGVQENSVCSDFPKCIKGYWATFHPSAGQQ